MNSNSINKTVQKVEKIVMSVSNSILQKSQISISPQYLVQLSRIAQLLNHFHLEQQLPDITPEYKQTLVSSFSTLNSSLQLYANSEDSQSMISLSIIKCRGELELYCMGKLAEVLAKESEDVAIVVTIIMDMYRENLAMFEKVVVMERRGRLSNLNKERDTVIQKLREELVYRKQYIAELKARLEEVQLDNTKIYQKVIQNAKNKSDRTLSISPKKPQTLSPSPNNASLAKLKNEALQGTSHKTISAKQAQQTIIDIMQTKQKQQTVKGKKVSLKNFLKTYFRYKFGMKELADQTMINFKEAVEFFSQSQEKNIFILFLKMCSEECQENYYWEQKIFYNNLVRVIKRYVNEKDSIHLDELERIYENKIIDQRSDINLTEKDVQYILINTYKTSQVDSLQMILNQILIQKLKPSSIQSRSHLSVNAQPLFLPSKKLINGLLNYELSRHLLKIQDIVRAIKDIDNGRGYLNQEELENLVVRLGIPEDKIQANYQLITAFQGKFVTYSEVIETVQKIRKWKRKQRERMGQKQKTDKSRYGNM